MRAALMTLSIALPAATLGSQADWKLQTPTNTPGVRSDHVLVSDLRGVLLFGGDDGTAPQNDLWRWIGGSWTKLTPATSPPGRLRHSGAFDIARQRFVVFGGSTGLTTGRMNDTWLFDRSSWSRPTLTASPSARNDHAMVYDWAKQRVILFGGRDATGDLNDTWSWDGVKWTKLSPAASPPPRRDHILAYDRIRRRVITYGGFHSGLQVRNDLWEFDGATWTEIKPPAGPSQRVGYGFTYDVARHRTVLFSGYDGSGQPADTWEWDGAVWTKRAPTANPTGRSGHAMTWDEVRRQVVMYGGWDNQFAGDTWLYFTSKVASYDPFGQGCKSSAGTPDLAATPGKLPWLGDTMEAVITGAPPAAPVGIFLGGSKTTWGVIRLPFDLAVLQMPGCNLYVSPDLLGILVNSGGTARWAVKLPLDAALAGVVFHNQGIVFDRNANPFGAAWTNGATATLGLR